MNIFFSKDRYKEYCEWRKTYYDDDKHDKVQKYYRKRELIEGRPLGNVGNTSLNRECLLMGSILRHGKKFMGILKDTPILSYEVKKEPSQINEKVILDDVDEYYKVKEYWMEKDPFIWDCFGTIFHCGLRPGELGKISYSDVHLKEGYVLIRNRKSKVDVINTPVPLVQSSREIFERLMSREGVSKNKDDIVFVREGRDKPYSSVYLNKLFKDSVKKVTGKCMTLHSLRHLFITMSIKDSIPLKIISGVVGHKDTTMINRVYSHLMWKDYYEVYNKKDQERELKRKRYKEKQLEFQKQTTNPEPPSYIDLYQQDT
jgi:integrase